MTPAPPGCPTPLPGNRLLFVSTRPSACFDDLITADIYLTRHHPVRGWLEPEPHCGVNSTAEEFSPSFIEADGVRMLYFSSNRTGLHKIYVSVLPQDGTWATPGHVDGLNAQGAGADIFVSTRSGPGNPKR